MLGPAWMPLLAAAARLEPAPDCQRGRGELDVGVRKKSQLRGTLSGGLVAS